MLVLLKVVQVFVEPVVVPNLNHTIGTYLGFLSLPVFYLHTLSSVFSFNLYSF